MEFWTPWILVAFIMVIAGYYFGTYHKPQKKVGGERMQPRDIREDEEYAIELTPLPKWEKAKAPPMPELPNGYGKDCLILMVKDPLSLYTYWEINPEKLLRKEKNIILRIYDITGVDNFNGKNYCAYRDEVIKGAVGEYFFNVDTPNRDYCVDLGILLEDGTFITLLRSNVVKTPRNDLSIFWDEEWQYLDGIYNMKDQKRIDLHSEGLQKNENN